MPPAIREEQLQDSVDIRWLFDIRLIFADWSSVAILAQGIFGLNLAPPRLSQDGSFFPGHETFHRLR